MKILSDSIIHKKRVSLNHNRIKIKITNQENSQKIDPPHSTIKEKILMENQYKCLIQASNCSKISIEMINIIDL